MRSINWIQINCVAIVLLLNAVVSGKHTVHVYSGHIRIIVLVAVCYVCILLIKLYAFDFISVTARSHSRGSGQY